MPLLRCVLTLDAQDTFTTDGDVDPPIASAHVQSRGYNALLTDAHRQQLLIGGRGAFVAVKSMLLNADLWSELDGHDVFWIDSVHLQLMVLFLQSKAAGYKQMSMSVWAMLGA